MQFRNEKQILSMSKKRQNGGQNFLKTGRGQEGDRSFLVIWQTELKVDLE